MLIKLKAISVALKPPPTRVGCLRAGGRSVVIFFVLLFMFMFVFLFAASA
jgi:hypothetical protein